MSCDFKECTNQLQMDSTCSLWCVHLIIFQKCIIVLKILKQMIANNTWMKLEDHCWVVICSKWIDKRTLTSKNKLDNFNTYLFSMLYNVGLGLVFGSTLTQHAFKLLEMFLAHLHFFVWFSKYYIYKFSTNAYYFTIHIIWFPYDKVYIGINHTNCSLVHVSTSNDTSISWMNLVVFIHTFGEEYKPYSFLVYLGQVFLPSFLK